MLFKKIKNYKIVLFFVVLLFALNLNAQSNIDSIKQIFATNSNDSLKASAAISIANTFKEKQIDSAYHYMEMAQTFTDTSDFEELQANYFFTLSKIQFKDGKGQVALLNAKKANDILGEESDNMALKGDILMAISRAYFGMRDYDNSLDYALRGEKIGQASRDSFLLTSSLDIRGNIRRMTKNFDKAIEHFEQGLSINKAMGREKSAARNLANIATVYSVMNEFEKSVPYFKEAIGIAETINDNFLQSFSCGNLGLNYVELEQPDSAQIYLERALTGYTAMNNKFRIIRTTSQLSRLYMSKSEYSEAIKLLLPAYEQSTQLSDIKLQDDLAFNLGDSYEKLGNYKLANKYHRIHMTLQDSMINDQVSKAVSDAEEKYESEKKEAEISRLSLEDQLNQVRISRQRMALGGSAIGIGLLSFLLFRLFRQNKKIKIQNQLITKADQEKETLLKEIHHRVKNNLQVISSLLGLQSMSIDDQKARDAIQEGRSRVHSMSLIHQNLYKKENLTGIEMGPYIKKLCQDLIQTYHVGQSEIALNDDVQDDLILDVETVIPIGLIINELVTNSLKYAFVEKAAGLITVKLHELGNQLSLVVSDDGIGLDEDVLAVQKESFGHTLIRAFRDKLGAELQIESNAGTSVSLIIKNYTTA